MNQLIITEKIVGEQVTIYVPKTFIGKHVRIVTTVVSKEDADLWDIADEAKMESGISTYLASHSALAKDWLSPEDEEAWKDL